MIFPSSFRLLFVVGTLALPLRGLAEPETSPVLPLEVEAVVADIVARNPELSFYQAEIEYARAGLRRSGTRENPEFALSIGRKRVSDPASRLSTEGTAWSVSVTQVFEWPGRLALRKSIANHDVAMAELGLERFQATLAARARTLALGLRAAQEKADAAAEVAARYRELREVFLARDPAGITPLLETRVIEAQELVLQHRATEAHLAQREALLELNQLRGLPSDTPLAVSPTALRFAAVPALDELLAAARQNNFEFRFARIELEQQGERVSLARSDQRPALAVGPYFSQEQAGERERTVGIGISVPLSLSSRARADTAAAEARRRQAETSLLLAQRTLERSLISLHDRLKAKTTALSDWRADSPARFREAAALADRHYRLGAVPLATYLELQTSYLEAVDSYLETELEALDAAQQLEVLTGLNFKLVSASTRD